MEVSLNIHFYHPDSFIALNISLCFLDATTTLSSPPHWLTHSLPFPSPLSHAHSPRYLRGGSQLMLLSRTRTWLPSLARLEVRTPKGSTRLGGQTWDPPSLTHTVLPRRLKINCENKSEKVCGKSWAGEGKSALCPTGWKRSYSYKGEMAPKPESRSHLPSAPVHSVYPALPPAFSGAARPPALRRFWV